MSEPTIRVIEGCKHQVERMHTWCDNGGCPICLTAECGLLNERIAALQLDAKRFNGASTRLRRRLKEIRDWPHPFTDETASAMQEHAQEALK